MSDLLNYILAQGDQFRRARLPSLYSDFTLQRNSNPDGFAANTAAWIAALSKAAQGGLLPAPEHVRDTLSMRTGEDLLQSLETKEWGRPLALGTVIEEAVYQRQMMPYQDFLSANKSIYSRKWTVQPWWLLSWGLKQLGLVEPSTTSGRLPAGRFVLVHNVEEAANKIMKHMTGQSNQVDRVYPIPMFGAEAAKVMNTHEQLTESDLQIILRYLARDKSAIIYNRQIIKFKSPGDTSSTLSTQDRTIGSLKSFIADLSGQVALLSAKILELSETAQTAVKNRNKVSALAALRSKKLNETVLAQRTETLFQLEEVYSKIEQAADQVAMVRVMEASAGVLRSLHAEVGGVEKVDDVMEGLGYEMSKVEEVSSAIEAGAHEQSVVDEDAVDEELESLERQARSEQTEKEALETQEKLEIIGEMGELKEQEVSRRDAIPTNGTSPLQASRGAPETLIEAGINMLNRLSLDEERSPVVNVSEAPERPAERILNAASES